MAVPATVVYFSTYEQIKSRLGYKYTVENSDWWKPLVAGGSARGDSMNISLCHEYTVYTSTHNITPLNYCMV